MALAPLQATLNLRVWRNTPFFKFQRALTKNRVFDEGHGTLRALRQSAERRNWGHSPPVFLSSVTPEAQRSSNGLEHSSAGFPKGHAR